MAKRSVRTPSSRARRAPAGASRPTASGAGRPRGAKAGTKSKAGARPKAKARSAKPPARRAPAKPKVAAIRVPQETTGRGAAQPGGRRTVELFENEQDQDPTAPTLPSSLDFDQRPSAARSGRAELEERYREHPETGPALTGGDIDADWQSAYAVGDEAPGGDNPTPGQAVVDEFGTALGVRYDPEEELRSSDAIESRDRHRWELNPASSEDYPERTRGRKKKGK
jgi:hypothetical protein